MDRFEPFSDMVLVQPTEQTTEDRRTEGGILLPGTVDLHKDKKVLLGIVHAVGPGRPPHTQVTPAPMRSRVGDLVAYDDQAMTAVELNGKHYHIVPEGLILGRVVKEGMPAYRSR